ncbi:MAG: response regulator transcription factor [Chloroflexota bacterium]
MGINDLIRVMIVDDHAIVRQGLIVSLENFEDFEIVGSLGDAREAITICTNQRVDVVIMDMVMPMMDGVTATRIIRERSPHTQVIALTSFDSDNTVQQALQAGAISYLMKNVSVEDLASAVRKASIGQSTLAPEATQVLIRAAVNPPALGHDLTEREREVLALMIEGLNNREIAERLIISSSTAKNHVSSILDKLGTTSRTQAVAFAVEHKLLDSR